MRRHHTFPLLLAAATIASLGTGTRARADEVLLPFGPSLQQPDALTCGPTCAVMVLNYYGIAAGITPMAEKSETYLLECCEEWRDGGIEFGFTRTQKLANAMGHYGLKTDVLNGTAENLRASITKGTPAIVLVRSASDLWHYVVVTGYRTSPAQFRIHDTSRQVYWMDEADLMAIWRFSHGMRGLVGDRMTVAYVDDLQCTGCRGRGTLPTPWIDVECIACGGSGKVAIVIDTWWGRRYRRDYGTCGVCKGAGRWREGGESVPCIMCGSSGHGDPARKVVESFETGNTFLVPSGARDSQPSPAPAPPVVTPPTPGHPSEDTPPATPHTPGGDGCASHDRCACHSSPQHTHGVVIEAIRRCRDHRGVLRRCLSFRRDAR